MLKDDYTGIKVFRNTAQALKAENVTSFELLQDPGNVLRFDTLMSIKTAKEASDAFNVLNAYVKWRGDEYVDSLYKAFEVMNGITKAYIHAPDNQADAIRNKFSIQLGNIITLLNIDDIYEYVTKIKPVPIPPDLKTSFNQALETDGLGTRDQTYIVDDYEWLMALIVIFKAVYGPLSELIRGNPDHLKELREVQMLDLLKQQKLYIHPSFQKLKSYISAIVDRTFDKEDLDEVKILTARLPKDTIKELYLAKGIFGKIVTMDQMESTDKFHIVKYLFKDVNSKIKNVGPSSEMIRNKNKPSDASSDSEDKESVIESYRISTEVPPGMAEEFNWAVRDIDVMLRQLPKSVRDNMDMEDVKLGMELASRFEPGNITNIHIMIFGVLFKRLLDPRGIDYLRLDSIRRMIGLGFAVLKSYNCKPLAYILVSKRISPIGGNGNQDDVMEFGAKINGTKAKGYREDELEELYPFRLLKEKETEPGDLKVLDWIHALYLEIFKYNWQPPVELSVGIKDMLISTLRNCITDFLIENERRLNGRVQ